MVFRTRLIVAAFLCGQFLLLATGQLFGLHACHHREAVMGHECGARCDESLDRMANCAADGCVPESLISHVIEGGLAGSSYVPLIAPPCLGLPAAFVAPLARVISLHVYAPSPTIALAHQATPPEPRGPPNRAS